MAWEILENKSASTEGKVDISSGARIKWRQMKLRKTEGFSKFIECRIGKKAAVALALTADKHRLNAMFGTGEEAGSLAVTVDNAEGQFMVKRAKSGDYFFTISEKTANGRLKLDFTPIEVEKINILKIKEGKPVFGVIDIRSALA